MIEIKAFQAFDGDCIWLRYGESKIVNVVIDVGYLGTYRKSLKTVFEWCINNNEQVDLLIITHTDSDHISGIKGLQSDIDLICLIKCVWFNSPYMNIADDSSDNISYREGKDVFNFFKEHGVQIFNDIHNAQESFMLNNAIITVLSPDEDDLLECNKNWIKSDNISSHKSDWGISIDDLAYCKTIYDNSTTNKASIAFLFEYVENKIIFMGDSVSSIIIEKLKNMGIDTDNPLKLDLLKLAHHGSNRNFSNDLLELVSCKNYLISSNGSNLSKETLAKIIVFNKHSGIVNTTFYFNYGQDEFVDLITQSEIQIYNVNCVFAEKQSNYINIKF